MKGSSPRDDRMPTCRAVPACRPVRGAPGSAPLAREMMQY